jgi:hypothetical protein
VSLTVGCVPSGCGIDRFSAALAALEEEADLGDGDGFGEGVDVDIGGVVAGFA